MNTCDRGGKPSMGGANVVAGWAHPTRVAMVAVAALLLALSGPAPVGAQATRTWISGVGDDANPCSRTAPCKTFAGAISKTAAKGIINVLDPGGFGQVTITKSITLDGTPTGQAGLLASTSSGVVVNPGAGDFVVLRGLEIDGLGSATHGITWISNPNNGTLYIEDTVINDFAGNGLNVALGATTVLGELYMRNVVVRNNISTASTSVGAGVYLNAQNGLVRAVLDNVSLENNNYGLNATGRSRAVMSGGTASGNASAGIRAAAAAGTEVDLFRVSVSANGTGIKTDLAPSSIVRMEGVVVTGNGTGVDTTASGTVLSPGASPGGPGMNIIFGNTTDVAGSIGNLPTR